MQIPIMVATATEASVRAGSEIGAPIVGHSLKIVRAHVLTPFPHVPGHIE